jgi:nucleotide-binding universal stress UspA family protein
LARAGRGQVYLFHALEPPPVPGGAMAFALAEAHLAARAHEALERQLDRVGASAEEVAGFAAEDGQAGPVLCAAADRLDADVIVVAALAAAPLPRHRVGSTARHLLREGSRPVLIVKEETRIPPIRVVAPVDLSPLAGDSLRCGLALLCGVTIGKPPELVLLHVVDGRRGEPVEQPREALASFVAENTSDYDGPIRSEVRHGDAVAEILAAGEREEPDLLLLGTHGRSGWQRLRLGSVAETVIREAPTSILVVPPPAAFGSGLAEAVGTWARGSA